MLTIARIPKQLANSIRQRRRELGLTQETLAAKIGVRQRTVSDLETSAATRVDTLLRALAGLDLELVIRPRTKSSQRDIERVLMPWNAANSLVLNTTLIGELRRETSRGIPSP